MIKKHGQQGGNRCQCQCAHPGDKPGSSAGKGQNLAESRGAENNHEHHDRHPRCTEEGFDHDIDAKTTKKGGEDYNAGTWRFVCHASEIREKFDYRLVKVGSHELILVKGEDGSLRGFYNSCAHRGARLLRQVAGNLDQGHMTCSIISGVLIVTGVVLPYPSRRVIKAQLSEKKTPV